MRWHPDPTDRSAWSAAGGIVMGVFGAGAVAWWLAAEPSNSTIPTWPAYVFAGIAVVGFYCVLAPLLRWWPWGAQGKPRTLALSINSLDLSGLGAANFPRLQLWVKVSNLGRPTILHDWQLRVSMDGHSQVAEHLAGGGQQPNRTQMRALDEMTGTTPFQGEATGLVYFVLPNVSRPVFRASLTQAVLSLSVKDQDGGEWHAEQRVDSMGPPEEYDPNA